MRLTAIAAALFLVVSAGGDQPAAQTKKPFIADDILDVSTAAVADMTDDGARVAVTIRRMRDNADTDNYRYGDPTYVAPSRVQLLVLDVKTLTKQLPFKQLVNLRQAAWSHDGTRLAVLLVDNPEDLAPLAPARGGRQAPPAGMGMGAGGGRGTGGDPAQAQASGRSRGREESAVPLAPGGVGSVPRLFIWDTVKAKLTEVPRSGDTAVTVNSGLDWTPDDSRLIVSVRPFGSDRTAREKFLALTEGPIVVHSSKEPFLEWDLLQRENRRRGVVEIDPATGGPTRILLDQRITSYNVSRDATLVTYLEDVTEKTDYEEIGGTMNRLRLASRPAVGEPKTLVEAADLKGVQLRWSDDGRTFAYAKKGEVFVQRIDEAKPRSLTPPSPEEARKAEAEKAGAKEPEKKDEKKETFAVSMFSRDGRQLLVTSAKGWYVVDVASAARTQLFALDEDEEKNPRREAVAWSPDGSAIYFTESERVRWNRGLMRLDVASKKVEALVKDARLFSGFRMARNGESFVFSMSDGDQPADLYVADARLGSIKRLIEANAWIADRTLPKSELVPYRDTDGKLLYGVLRYPVNYVKGQKYPTIFEIYETFFDNGFNARAAFLASHGYAVFHPSVNLVVGHPGEAWLKGVTAAANRLIEMGVADADRLGVHGTSYGGYATVLLITQTDRFKAAINVSGKVDMVSFYTDSPRLGVRNTHAPEKSQDRIGGTLWEFPERYLEHSAILRADRIKTPLLCITGDQDPNVPASQSREIYYALRRLGKEVEWVRYVNGAHRPPSSAEESVDFEKRILGWYDKYLKAEAKPAGK